MTNIIERHQKLYLPSLPDLTYLEKFANTVYLSGLIPNSLLTSGGDKKEQIVAKILTIFIKGYELKITPMQSLAEIGIISGVPIISSKLMLALIYRDVPPADIVYIEISNRKCIIKARRRHNNAFTTFEYTFEDASKAGLIQRNSNTWKKYPRQMLKWRAVSNMARTLFPDVIMGCYLPGEIEVKDESEAYGNYKEEYSEDEDEKLAKVSIIETVDEEFNGTDAVFENEDPTIIETTPEQLFKQSMPKEEKKESNPINIGLDLKLDLPPEPKKKVIEKPKKKIIEEPKKNTSSVSISSLMGKIKDIQKPTLKSKKEPPKKKKEGKISLAAPKLSLKKIESSSTKKKETPKKKTTKKKFTIKETKSFMNPDFYFSSSDGGKITNDLPWNILKKLIIPIVNTEKEDVFTSKIGAYYREFLNQSSPNETIGAILLEAYTQYCEIDLRKESGDVEKLFHQNMKKIINNIYGYLLNEHVPSEKPEFIKGILKETKLQKNYSDWIIGFLESRGLIKITGNNITILV